MINENSPVDYTNLPNPHPWHPDTHPYRVTFEISAPARTGGSRFWHGVYATEEEAIAVISRKFGGDVLRAYVQRSGNGIFWEPVASRKHRGSVVRGRISG